ncbi:MAG: hypothetical protein ABL907_14490 [Hyphomicrobium sp.]
MLAPGVKNADRSEFLATVVRARDFILLAELIESLQLMPGLQAHDILDRADAALMPKDRLFLQTLLDATQAHGS